MLITYSGARRQLLFFCVRDVGESPLPRISDLPSNSCLWIHKQKQIRHVVQAVPKVNHLNLHQQEQVSHTVQTDPKVNHLNLHQQKQVSHTVQADPKVNHLNPHQQKQISHTVQADPKVNHLNSHRQKQVSHTVQAGPKVNHLNSHHQKQWIDLRKRVLCRASRRVVPCVVSEEILAPGPQGTRGHQRAPLRECLCVCVYYIHCWTE